MTRIPEPELMEDLQQAIAYGNADFSASNRLFVKYISNDLQKQVHKIMDIGCGTGNVDIELALEFTGASIVAIDGSAEMVKLALERVKDYNLEQRVGVLEQKIPGINLEPGGWDLVLSKDMLHHLPDPFLLWNEAERFCSEGTTFYVADLIRPENETIAREIVQMGCANEPEVLKTDFYNSLLASYTINEIESQLSKTRFEYRISPLGNRHFIARCFKRKIDYF